MSKASGFGAGRLVAKALPVIIASALFAYFAQFLGVIGPGDALRAGWDWAPSLGVRFSFLLDGLSLTFALLITGVGALVMLHAQSYLGANPQFGRFALYLTSFMLAMLGLVLADNLITLFVFWELTTVTSYLLIGFTHADAKSRRSALQALLVTGAGGLALLAGLILLGLSAGSFELSEILVSGDVLRDHALYLPILILVLIGAFTKSAQVPFHFWLPNAMAAPTPVSAYLHSATMVKGGIYLLARLHPALGGTPEWLWTLTLFGAATAVFASLLAMKQTDLKQTLAYTTLMALGTLTLFLASDSAYSVTAAMTFLVAHALYKAALFLVIGLVDFRAGSRDADVLSGLARAMPVTAAAAALAALSMAGLPPLIGFIAKEVAYKAAEEVESSFLIVAGAALAANALMVAAAGVVALRPFFTPRPKDAPPLPKSPREGPIAMWLGPVVLAALGLVFGLAPKMAQDLLVAPASAAVLGRVEVVELKLWAGVNLALMLSLATFAIGFALYAVHQRLRAALQAAGDRIMSLDAFWDRILAGLMGLAGWQTRVLQSGVLRTYLATVFATFVVGVGGALVWSAAQGTRVPAFVVGDAVLFKHWAVIALTLAGAAACVVLHSRIGVLAALGVVGVGVALIFIMFGAPDVAITQLLVETLVVVLMAVALLKLPSLEAPGERRFRPRDAVLAIAAGVATMGVALSAFDGPIDRSITDYYEAASWPEAFGRNIVNVILVDFRALDTFGEIAVVAVAAISAFALLATGKGPKTPAAPPPGQAPSSSRSAASTRVEAAE